MSSADVTSPEQLILRACVSRDLSRDDAFNELYLLYADVVRGWLLVSVKRAEVEDLFQDIWIVFYRRWQQWQFLAEMQDPEARPVASFLYRTFRFVLEGHRRRSSHSHESIEAVEELPGDLQEPDRLLLQLELGQCLELARKICLPQELEVLLAKISGLSVREIATAISVTESVVDHRFRSAVGRLQKRLNKQTKTNK